MKRYAEYGLGLVSGFILCLLLGGLLLQWHGYVELAAALLFPFILAFDALMILCIGALAVEWLQQAREEEPEPPDSQEGEAAETPSSFTERNDP